jgi:AcrR family transcriptional regulator
VAKDTWWNLPEDKRRRITRAALAEFGTRGFSTGSLNVIAREAGIAKGSLFQYFDDKLDLFVTVCEAAAASTKAAALEGVDLEEAPYFDSVRVLVANWLRFFRKNPIERASAYAAAHEMDAAARTAVGGVTNQAYVEVLRPMAERAEARGELRAGVDIDQLVALTVLVLRHLNSAPFYPHIDPVLGLYEKGPRQVDGIASALVDTLERAFAPAH